MDLTFWERETAIVFKPGPSLDKSENGTFVFSYVQPIRIFMWNDDDVTSRLYPSRCHLTATIRVGVMQYM